MNSVTAVSGQRQEGKTTALLLKKRDDLAKIIAAHEHVEQHFIICCKEVEVCELYIKNITKDREIEVIAVSTEQELHDVLRSLVEVSDCIVYVDDPETIMPNFSSWILTFVDGFPNRDIGNGINIVYSRDRHMF